MLSRSIRMLALTAVFMLVAYLVFLGIPKQRYFSDRVGEVASISSTSDTQSNHIDDFIDIKNEQGLQVSFRVRRPASWSGLVPLLVVVGGQQTGKDAVALASPQPDLAFLAIDYPYSGPREIDGLLQTMGAIDDVQQAFLDTPVALSLALNWAIEQPWVDKERIELVGVSLGVPFAAVAGAKDRRFRRVWLLHGGIDNVPWLEHAARRRIESSLARSVIVRGLLHVTHGSSFDTRSRIESIAPRPLVFVAACDDDFVPPEALEPLAELSQLGHVTTYWTQGLHINPKRPKELRQLLDIVLNGVRGLPISAASVCI